MDIQKFLKYVLILFGLIGTMLLFRIVPHPPNFTPIIALSLYLPILFGFWSIPFIILGFATTDYFIGFHSLLIWTWGSLAIIGFISKLLTGNPWKSDLFDFDEGVKILRGENVSEGFLRWGKRTRYWKEKVDVDSKFFVCSGDIIIPMDGSKVGKNFVRIKEEDLPILLHQRMSRIRLNKGYLPKYIEYFIGSDMFQYYITISKTDPMIPHITQKNIYDFYVSIPKSTEQQQIVEYLDEQTGLIDKTISNEENRIELLKEYRQSLISEVVTGKRKVTNG